VPPVELVAACRPSFPLESGGTIDIGRVAAHPLLLLDSGFVVRKTFDTACRLARLKPNILFESGVPHNLLAFAEAGLGVAVIPSVVQTHRYALRLARITHERKPLREPSLLCGTSGASFRATSGLLRALAAHMRERSSITRQPVPKLDGPNKRRSPVRTKVR